MRFLTLILLFLGFPVYADPAIVGHINVPNIDHITLQRIYTGKVVEVQGIHVTPVNLNPGDLLRVRFLQIYMQQDEDQYAAYWIVRRYIGKGKPPKDFKSTKEVIDFITETPGAIGYVDTADVTPNLKVLLSHVP